MQFFDFSGYHAPSPPTVISFIGLPTIIVNIKAAVPSIKRQTSKVGIFIRFFQLFVRTSCVFDQTPDPFDTGKRCTIIHNRLQLGSPSGCFIECNSRRRITWGEDPFQPLPSYASDLFLYIFIFRGSALRLRAEDALNGGYTMSSRK